MSRYHLLRWLLLLPVIAAIVVGFLLRSSTLFNHAEITVIGAVTASFAGPVAQGAPTGAPGDALSAATATCDFDSTDTQQVYVAFPSEGAQWLLLWRSVMDPVVGIDNQVRLAGPGSRSFRNAEHVGGEGSHALSRLHMKLDHVRLQGVVFSNDDLTAQPIEPVVAGPDAFLSVTLDIAC
jgi:hypothetical protein